ncbi:MAG TPA: cytochrome c oxidase assembly protein [Caulobacteraceae bacterium]|jgi:cytochrome c oxidase assembly protein subunit 11
MADRNRQAAARTALICAVVVVGMTGAAFAAVPLYRAFCQVTGFDGTTQRADGPSQRVLDRTVQVRFDGNVRGMAWDFRPEQVSQTVKIGETTMAFFKATNTSDRPVTGTSTFNVVPEAAGAHFRKIECFCFQEQTIAPGETVEFPVVYFVDPELVTDPDARKIDEITLSYTFFPVEPKRPEGRSAVAPGRG